MQSMEEGSFLDFFWSWSFPQTRHVPWRIWLRQGHTPEDRIPDAIVAVDAMDLDHLVVRMPLRRFLQDAPGTLAIFRERCGEEAAKGTTAEWDMFAMNKDHIRALALTVIPPDTRRTMTKEQLKALPNLYKDMVEFSTPSLAFVARLRDILQAQLGANPLRHVRIVFSTVAPDTLKEDWLCHYLPVLLGEVTARLVQEEGDTRHDDWCFFFTLGRASYAADSVTPLELDVWLGTKADADATAPEARQCARLVDDPMGSSSPLLLTSS